MGLHGPPNPFSTILSFLLSIAIANVRAQNPAYGAKVLGAATYYGGGDGGNCGYGGLVESGYTIYITAAPPMIYKLGLGCGSCFKISCVNSKYCKKASLVVPVTDACNGCNVCGENCAHFDLSIPAFERIADLQAGVIPLQYERVPCKRQGNIKFFVSGSAYWINVHFRNVAGPGDVVSLDVKPANGGWTPMYHAWGINFEYNGFLQSPLNFRIISGYDNQVLITKTCLPLNWVTGVYDCEVQFKSPITKPLGSPKPKQSPPSKPKRSPPPKPKRSPPPKPKRSPPKPKLLPPPKSKRFSPPKINISPPKPRSPPKKSINPRKVLEISDNIFSNSNVSGIVDFGH